VPLYTFRLRGDDIDVRDDEGVTLANAEIAYRYARDVVRELMNHREAKTRHWCLDVYEEGKKINEIPFVTLDGTPDGLSAESLGLIEYHSQQIRAIKDMLLALRASRQELQAITLRARGKPHLTAIEGEKVIRDDT
jgi:hypothetical protein